MYSWVIKIAAAAVALTVVGYILPKGNIKKAAMLALFIRVAGSLLAGVIPAYRALSIKAVDAIREE